MTIDPDFAVHRNAIELDFHEFIFPIGGRVEGFSIPGNSARQKRGATGVGRRELAFNAEIVRHIEFAPGVVSKIASGSFGNVARMKAPIEIEFLAQSWGSFSMN